MEIIQMICKSLESDYKPADIAVLGLIMIDRKIKPITLQSG